MIHEDCGLFGIYGHVDAARLTYFGLYAQQHRGQESAGIVSVDDAGDIHDHRGMGLVPDIFEEKPVRPRVSGARQVRREYGKPVRYAKAKGNEITSSPARDSQRPAYPRGWS